MTQESNTNLGTSLGISLGAFLRGEREKRGMTIEQVASATKINVKLIHLLEADRFSDLPAKPFVRGFVTAYARFVGLDPKEILTKYNSYLNEKTSERPTQEKGHMGYAFEKREGEQSRTLLWAIMGGFVLLGGVLILVLKPSFRHHRKANLEKLKSIHVKAIPSASPAVSLILTPIPTPIPSVAPTVTPVPSAAPSPLASEHPDPLHSGSDLKASEVKFKVLFKSLSDLWIRYQVDEKPIMMFPFRKDRILVLRANKSIRFQASDSDAISYNLNQSGYRVLGTEPKLRLLKNTPTLFFPSELIDTVEEAFPGERPLPKQVPQSHQNP